MAARDELLKLSKEELINQCKASGLVIDGSALPKIDYVNMLLAKEENKASDQQNSSGMFRNPQCSTRPQYKFRASLYREIHPYLDEEYIL